MPCTARAVYIIGPDHKLKLSILYPASTGRNFDELIRVIHSLQLTHYHKVATPANWNTGEMCMVVPSLNEQEACKAFGGDKVFKSVLPSGKEYMRTTMDPSVIRRRNFCKCNIC